VSTGHSKEGETCKVCQCKVSAQMVRDAENMSKSARSNHTHKHFGTYPGLQGRSVFQQPWEFFVFCTLHMTLRITEQLLKYTVFASLDEARAKEMLEFFTLKGINFHVIHETVENKDSKFRCV
jgi:hypothetical protein